MPVRGQAVEPRVEIKARLTRNLYERLVAECGSCGCSIQGVVTIAIAREIARRNGERIRAANHPDVLAAIENGVESDAD